MEEILEKITFKRKNVTLILVVLSPIFFFLMLSVGFLQQPAGLSFYEKLPIAIVVGTNLFILLSLGILSVNPPILTSSKWMRFFSISIFILILSTILTIALAIHTTGAFHIDFSKL